VIESSPADTRSNLPRSNGAIMYPGQMIAGSAVYNDQGNNFSSERNFQIPVLNKN